MGMTVILVIFSVFAISRSSGFDIPSLSAILKLNLGPPSVSSHGTAVPNRVSSSMSTSSILERKRFVNLAPEASSPLTAPSRHIGKFHKYHHKPIHQGPSVAPSDSPSHSVSSSISPAPAPTTTSNEFIITPTSSFVKKKAPPPPFLALPPAPPNKDCTSMTCSDPLTYTPPGSPCGCVWPIEVRLRLDIAVYTFFPLVTELAKEIASSISLNQTQVRIMGANAASQQQSETIVLINLVPSRENFNRSTALGIYNKFWQKVVIIKPKLFGAYDVVNVQYPGISTIFNGTIFPGLVAPTLYTGTKNTKDEDIWPLKTGRMMREDIIKLCSCLLCYNQLLKVYLERI